MKTTREKMLEKIEKILIKKAEGYFYQEETNEYQLEPAKNQPKSGSEQLDFFEDNLNLKKKGKDSFNQNFVLVKKKVTSHHVPPDLTALKLLLDNFLSSGDEENDLSKMSDQQLNALRKELIKKLSEEEND